MQQYKTDIPILKTLQQFQNFYNNFENITTSLKTLQPIKNNAAKLKQNKINFKYSMKSFTESIIAHCHPSIDLTSYSTKEKALALNLSDQEDT